MDENAIAGHLAEQGYCIVPDFFPDSAGLRQSLIAARDAGRFHRAAVGQGVAQRVRDEIRGDHVMWLEPTGGAPVIEGYFAAMERPRKAINQTPYLGLFDYEAHFAWYPPGAFYQKHLDGFAGDKRRKVSCVLYLNDHWQANEGGALRLFLPQGERDVLPQAGTLACFLSDDLWHAVQPATRERMSITGWFKLR